MKNSQLEVSFLDPKLLKKLCRSYGAADSAYQSYSAAGLTYFKSDMSEPAFLEFGGALQISHVQISNSETRSWRWAARLVESTNKVIFTLNESICLCQQLNQNSPGLEIRGSARESIRILAGEFCENPGFSQIKDLDSRKEFCENPGFSRIIRIGKVGKVNSELLQKVKVQVQK